MMSEDDLKESREDWIEFVTKEVDLFQSTHCGYWLRGVKHADGLGWLAWEEDEEHSHGDEPNRAEAEAAWPKGESLPEGWYRLDRELAEKAWDIGVKRWGERWYDEGDVETYDVVLQVTLFGEVRYG